MKLLTAIILATTIQTATADTFISSTSYKTHLEACQAVQSACTHPISETGSTAVYDAGNGDTLKCKRGTLISEWTCKREVK